MIKKIWRMALRIFSIANWYLGVLALPVIGGMVFLINDGWDAYKYNNLLVLAEAKQAGLIAGITGIPITATMSGLIQLMAFHRRYWSGMLIPCSVTITLHLPGQFVNETPNLFWSVIAPVLLTFVTSISLMPLTRLYLQDRKWGRLGLFFKPFFKIRKRTADPE